MGALALATPILSLIGGMMAALTGARFASGRRSVSLLILPIAMPVLIFGARAADLACICSRRYC